LEGYRETAACGLRRVDEWSASISRLSHTAICSAARSDPRFAHRSVRTAVMCRDIKENAQARHHAGCKRRLSRADRLAIRPRTVATRVMTDTTCRACKISVVSICRAS
jgi:hypothetical protein